MARHDDPDDEEIPSDGSDEVVSTVRRTSHAISSTDG